MSSSLFFPQSVPVGTTSALLCRVAMRGFQSLMIKPVLAIGIGGGGSEIPIAAGESFVMTHTDFDQKTLNSDLILDIYASAAVATTCIVSQIRRH